jgi:sec-independent protein translocase protein TatB
MFDIGWSELLVIAAVAIVVVGPKDLPRMLRTFGNYAGKARRIANDFKRQFDEALREAELEDVRKSVEEMSKLPTLTDLSKPAERTALPAGNAPAGHTAPAASPAPVGESPSPAAAAPAGGQTVPPPEPAPAEPKP